MSEIIQIQTYATCDKTTFARVLQRYRKTLEHIGCHDKRVQKWLVSIAWPTSEDDNYGDIFASSFILTPDRVPSIECAGMDVSLYLSSGMPSVEPQPAWVGFNLHFDTEVVKDNPISTYKAGVGGSIWQIMYELSISFQELGVYFTDEWQANHAWRALAEGSGDPWVFDLAIFPRKLASQFERVPAGFQGTVVEHGFGFAQANRWHTLPWLDTP